MAESVTVCRWRKARSSDVRLGDVRGCDVRTERLLDTTRVASNQMTVDAVVPVWRSTSARHRNKFQTDNSNGALNLHQLTLTMTFRQCDSEKFHTFGLPLL